MKNSVITFTYMFLVITATIFVWMFRVQSLPRRTLSTKENIKCIIQYNDLKLKKHLSPTYFDWIRSLPLSFEMVELKEEEERGEFEKRWIIASELKWKTLEWVYNIHLSSASFPLLFIFLLLSFVLSLFSMVHLVRGFLNVKVVLNSFLFFCI